ncbi:hypothetical protein DVH24_038830 [Malus domestica]|uniref:Uncharacterized protein n=1 Tax=Malus domestica TaxID=3750 RepID=A0A498KB37_MALDO|nr:hypothetical protein DVH24_038830 [Malus domestica]
MVPLSKCPCAAHSGSSVNTGTHERQIRYIGNRGARENAWGWGGGGNEAAPKAQAKDMRISSMRSTLPSAAVDKRCQKTWWMFIRKQGLMRLEMQK